MTDAQRSSWLGAGLVVVIALLGFTLWKVTQADPDRQIAALSAKVESTEGALAKIQDVVATGDIRQRLSELSARIEKTNAALAELQKGTALKSVADKLEQLNAAIQTTDTTLADITRSIPQRDIGSRIETISTDLKTISTKLAEMERSTPAEQVVAGLAGKVETIGADVKTIGSKLAGLETGNPADQVAAKVEEIKQAIPPDVTGQLAALSTQIKSINDSVASLQQPASLASAGSNAAISDVVGSLKSSVEEATALRGKLADQVASLQDAAKAIAAPQPADVIVVYLDMPGESPRPQTVATVSPLTVEFTKVGSTDADGQAGMLATRLKDIIKDRKDCTISVAGYADTMGRDDWNLTISKRRARNVAEKLKIAFAGQGVQINEAAWGERRLKDWTPDETPNATNRRVDVSVNCKS
jgi:outer membrane protein OmpA-like peptidoglycan-associated protein